MKRLALLLVVLTLSSACGKDPVSETDPELQFLSDAYISMAKEQGLTVEPVPMVFTDTMTDKVARCHFREDGNYISISKEYWDTLDSPDGQSYKLAIVLHEQGHCLFRLEHVQATEIMNASLVKATPSKVEKYWKYVKGE